MKRLILLLFFAAGILFLSAEAQTVNVRFNPTETFRTFSAVTAADTVNGTAELGKVFFVNKGYKYTYMCQASATRVSDSGQVNFILYGSMDGTKYYTVTTIPWYMTTIDTAVMFNSNTTYVAWRYLKTSIKGVGSGTRAKLGNLYLNVNK